MRTTIFIVALIVAVAAHGDEDHGATSTTSASAPAATSAPAPGTPSNTGAPAPGATGTTGPTSSSTSTTSSTPNPKTTATSNAPLTHPHAAMLLLSAVGYMAL